MKACAFPPFHGWNAAAEGPEGRHHFKSVMAPCVSNTAKNVWMSKRQLQLRSGALVLLASSGNQVIVEELLDNYHCGGVRGCLFSYAAMLHARALALLTSLGDQIIVEEFLDGEEASFFALVNGEESIAMAAAQ
eukprot:scaffold106522_cov13-Tisochrysis_lutea.AAC.1